MQSDFLNPPSIEHLKSALFIQPHPDDNEIAAGGTMARLRANGCKVYSLTVTDGRLGGDNMEVTEAEVAWIRKGEAKAAARVLQIERVRMKAFKDQTRASVGKIAKRLAEVIDDICPEAVFYPDPNLPNEWHQDHIKVGKAVEAAIAMSNWDVAVYAQYFTREPNTTVDIEAYYLLKMQAIKCHKSQITDEFLEFLDDYYAELAKGTCFKIVETFKAFSKLHTHAWVFRLKDSLY